MDGKVKFAAAKRLEYREFEMMEVADAGASSRVSMSPAVSGFTRINLSLECRRQFGLEVGDRVLVRSWPDITPAVAAMPDPGPKRDGYKYGGLFWVPSAAE